MTKSTTKTTRPATTRQTVRINGVRTVLTTRNGKVTAKAAPVLEWQLQAAQMKALKKLPGYAKAASEVRPGSFALAGDQNSAKRGPKARTQAIAVGLAAGEPDVRCYGYGGRLLLWENKVGKADPKNPTKGLEPSQVVRHPLLAALGHPVHVIYAVSEEDAADQAVRLVRGWLLEAVAANDNAPKENAEKAKNIA